MSHHSPTPFFSVHLFVSDFLSGTWAIQPDSACTTTKPVTAKHRRPAVAAATDTPSPTDQLLGRVWRRHPDARGFVPGTKTKRTGLWHERSRSALRFTSAVGLSLIDFIFSLLSLSDLFLSDLQEEATRAGADPSMCADQATVPETQACNTEPCPTDAAAARWEAGPYSGCSIVCGGGFRTREVRCVDGGGATLTDDKCAGAHAARETVRVLNRRGQSHNFQPRCHGSCASPDITPQRIPSSLTFCFAMCWFCFCCFLCFSAAPCGGRLIGRSVRRVVVWPAAPSRERSSASASEATRRSRPRSTQPSAPMRSPLPSPTATRSVRQHAAALGSRAHAQLNCDSELTNLFLFFFSFFFSSFLYLFVLSSRARRSSPLKSGASAVSAAARACRRAT